MSVDRIDHFCMSMGRRSEREKSLAGGGFLFKAFKSAKRGGATFSFFKLGFFWKIVLFHAKPREKKLLQWSLAQFLLFWIGLAAVVTSSILHTLNPILAQLGLDPYYGHGHLRFQSRY